MSLYQLTGLLELVIIESDAIGELNIGLQPELGFPIGMTDMHMDSRLFTRKEEKPETVFTKYCGGHDGILAPVANIRALRILMVRLDDLSL